MRQANAGSFTSIVKRVHFGPLAICACLLLFTLFQQGERVVKADTITAELDTTLTFLATPTATPTPPAFTCDYYAAPAGSTSGNGSITDPWDLHTALSKTTIIVTGKTLCLQGGTYRGKFKSILNGGTVRSAPGELAVLDGNFTTTLTAAMDAAQTTFKVADASAIKAGSNVEVWIDDEIITVFSKTGNNITNSARNAEGTVGGAALHASGATVTLIGGKQLEVAGNNTVYKDLEIMNSNPARGNGARIYEKFRGHGIFNTGSGNSFINNVIHDNVDGIFSGSSGSNTLFYGNLVYNNGLFYAVEYGRAIGQGLYLENAEGYSRVYEDIVLNNRAGAQYYGRTAAYVGGDTQGSVFANSGALLGIHEPNFIFGTETQLSPTGIVNESHFFHPHNANAGDVTLGYGAGITKATFTNNYVVGGANLLEVPAATESGTISGNKFYSTYTGSRYGILTDRALYPFMWNNNTYYNGVREAWSIDPHGYRTYTQWKMETGFDANSTSTSSALPNTVIVRPNAYAGGRANIIVYAAPGTTSINVDISATGLVTGQAYNIRNAFNYNGPSVISGTYNPAASTISLPLNGVAATVATPTGISPAPATTCPQFCAFIVATTTARPNPTPTYTPTYTPTNTPTNTSTPTPVPTPVGTVTGTIAYGNTAAARFVSNVRLSGTGAYPVSTLTDFPAGVYSLGVGPGTYTVTPSKTGGQNASINSFDAARITQHVIGASLLSGNQLIVADVSSNGVISSFDAGEIAGYVVSGPLTGVSGQWKFSPASRTYQTVNANVTGEDYSALLMGEVSGNWANTGARPDNGPERGATVNLPSLTVSADNEVVIPVAVQGALNKGIISYEFNLRYDPSVIQPQTYPVDLAGTASRGLFTTINADEPGLLRVAAYGPLPIDDNGVLLNLRFRAVGAPGSISPLTWERILFNEGDPEVTITDGQVELFAAAPQTDFQ